ncbi:hypothetical protein LSUCC0031_12155 [Rhodobacterales bacterium LSUCC0031]|nr:hypothetical protein [Rhodobacterales bacterium LSUCC0031]
MSRLLRDVYGHLRFRQAVLADPVLAVPLEVILAAPGGLSRFFDALNVVPGCGDRQRNDIQSALLAELRVQAAVALDAGDRELFHVITGQLVAAAPLPDAGGAQGVMPFYPTRSLEDVCATLWDAAKPARFILLPHTLPETAMTPAVLTCAGVTSAGARRGSFWSALGQADHGASKPQGMILIDRQVVLAICDKSGRYATLHDADVQAQRLRLADFCAGLPEGVVVKTADFAQAQLRACGVIGHNLVVPVPGGCAVLSDPAWLADVTATCARVQSHAHDLLAVLKR